MTQNRGPELVAVCSVLFAISCTATALRVGVRSFVFKSFGWDDGWMLIAFCAHVMYTTCAISGAHYGIGQHTKALTNEQIFMALRYRWLCYIAYCWCTMSAKISVGLFLLRITVKPLFRYIIYAMMCLIAVVSLIYVFSCILQCTPVAFFWDKSISNGTCMKIDIIGLTFMYSAISVMSDFTFFILSLCVVWGFKLPLVSSITLVSIFGIGCIACVGVTARTAYISSIVDPDLLWVTVDVSIWGNVEQSLVITAGSLATLHPLPRQLSLSNSATASGPFFRSLKPTGLRKQQWNGSPNKEAHEKSSLFKFLNALFRSKNGTVRDNDQDYVLGDIIPLRLRDDLVPEKADDKSGQGFKAWTIQAGRPSNGNLRHGAISMQREIHQKTESM